MIIIKFIKLNIYLFIDDCHPYMEICSIGILIVKFLTSNMRIFELSLQTLLKKITFTIYFQGKQSFDFKNGIWSKKNVFGKNCAWTLFIY